MSDVAIDIATALFVLVAIALAVSLRMYVFRRGAATEPPQLKVAILIFTCGVVTALLAVHATGLSRVGFLVSGGLEIACAGVIYVRGRRRD